MKKIIPYFVLISIFSCNYEPNYYFNENAEEINFSVKNNNVNRFFLGNKYYGYKGIEYKDSVSSYKLTIQNSLLKLKLKNRFISGFQDGIILEDTITFHLHDLSIIETTPIIINFNKYIRKSGNFLPVFTRENLELLKNRSSKIYSIDNNIKLQPVYISDSYKDELIPDLNQLIFHSSTKKNINRLKKLNIYPIDFSSFIVVHNPLTGFYTILPNFERFSTNKTNILLRLEELLKFNEPLDGVEKDKLYFNSLVRIDSSINFRNKIVVFEKESKVLFSNNAKLLFESCEVFFNGEGKEKIKIIGSYENSIIFNKCYVDISNSEFYNFSNFKDDKIILPAAITFYNSEVNINYSIFKNNLMGDDYINFYNSKFSVKNSLIENSFADAIDSDFSDGEIYKLNLINIGNDGLDFSGSKVSIGNSYFTGVQDKALSAGESSKIIINKTSILNSEMGIVVKDGSDVNAFSNILENNKIDYAVFFKKDFYMPPSLSVDSLNINSINLFQMGTKINVKKYTKLEFLNDVESLLYGKIYGKASK